MYLVFLFIVNIRCHNANFRLAEMMQQGCAAEEEVDMAMPVLNFLILRIARIALCNYK